MTPSISADHVLEQLPWLRAFAARLASPADVDDLVAQTWIAAWQDGDGADIDARGPRPWLSGVLRNKARMLHRGRARRLAREAKAVEGASAVVDQDLTRLSVLGEVVAAIRRLPAEDQAIVVQRYYEGRTAAEIGDALGLKAATVRSRLKRSLSRLRDDLDACHGGERAAWAGVLGVAVSPAGSGATALAWAVALVAIAAATVAAVVVMRAEPDAAVSVGPTATGGAVAAAEASGAVPRSVSGAGVRDAWQARKARVLAANEAFERSATKSPSSDAQAADASDDTQRLAELAGNFAGLQQGVFDDCVADLSLVQGTAFVVRSQVVGAPGVGTIVASVELDEGAVGGDGLLECVREGMYALQGPAPAEPFEAEMSFAFGTPQSKRVAEPEDEVAPIDATTVQLESVLSQVAGADECLDGADGRAVLLLDVGENGSVGRVRFEKTTLTLDVLDCLADHALAHWTLDAEAGQRLRVPVAFPLVQPSP